MAHECAEQAASGWSAVAHLKNKDLKKIAEETIEKEGLVQAVSQERDREKGEGEGSQVKAAPKIGARTPRVLGW